MTGASTKPVVFISYSHKDEPEKPGKGEVRWLTYVQSFFAAAVKHGVFDVWVDEDITGGADWDREIKEKLAACDICILLASRHSLASDYVLDTEIEIICARRDSGESVHFYPVMLTPCPKAGREKIQPFNLRPKDGTPLSGYGQHDRDEHMAKIADEIAELVESIADARTAEPQYLPAARSDNFNIGRLPDTPYQRLVGRDDQLAVLDRAWEDGRTNILSLVAEGGAGKSALVNEWLVRQQMKGYGGAESVLGWSFYSQGSKERATSAEPFLNWAVEKLGLSVDSTSASVKGEAIAKTLAARRVLLLLDGVEPLQHGPGPQRGQLKDQGLRSLLRRIAQMPPGAERGLVVLTSRLAVTDIGKWKGGVAPVVDLEELSEEAGAALLKDNGVWGADKELATAVREFGGHALALSLLASYLKDLHGGDVRRRDHVSMLLDDKDDPRHAHARRVLESYENEWLTDNPVFHAIMRLVGLFDRPASGDCLDALRQPPAIERLTDTIVGLEPDQWRRAIARLREARLLAPPDPSDPDGLDAHPLIREWFGERLQAADESAWRAAHSRLYEHLRDTTKEGATPTLEDLAPLYQAIPHGCRAGRHKEALDHIFKDRIYRRHPDGSLEAYALTKLGAFASTLAAISWFFDKPFETPIVTLREADRSWILGEAAFGLRGQGRFSEALPALQAALALAKMAEDWHNAAIRASNLSQTELFTGDVAGAIANATRSVNHADKSGDAFQMLGRRSVHADALHAAGHLEDAENLFAEAEQREKDRDLANPLLYALQGFLYCDLLFSKGECAAARDRALRTIDIAHQNNWLQEIALDTLTLGRAYLGLVLTSTATRPLLSVARDDAHAARERLNVAVDGLHDAGASYRVPRGLLARAVFRRAVGDWEGAERDLDEVEEIAEPGRMRLFLCDMALERARLAFARIEAFAPLNGVLDDGPPAPVAPDVATAEELNEEAKEHLAFARDTIADCGYHKRDEELAELEAVLAGERRFADLPPHV